MYPDVLGTTEGIVEEHLFRYEWAKPVCVGKSVLDYGCGSGYGSHLLSEIATHVTGYDISTEALKWAEYYVESRNNLEYTNQLPDEVFDCIVCFECIEHVPDPDSVLDWIASHAREYVLISSPKGAKDGLIKNKFHLFEFTEEEFLAKLSSRFVIDESQVQPIHCGEVVLCRCRIPEPNQSVGGPQQ